MSTGRHSFQSGPPGTERPALRLDGSVVKMKGLPFKATPEDVSKFFAGFSLDEALLQGTLDQRIYLKRHSDGRPNGEAFVMFDSPEEARRATHKDRETFGVKFGDRYVRVYPTLESDIADMQAAVAQQQPSVLPQVNGHASHHAHGHNDSVVKIKSLPFDATQLDIIRFFEGFRLKPNGVQLVVRSDNKATGEAFVDFESPEEAARSIREKDHKVFAEKFGDRYVRLIQVSRKEMQATLALRFGGEGVLKLKGIPFKASAMDVRRFFSNYRIKPDGVSFIMHADGRPTGMAFIEFETPQEAVRAMERDRAKFGPEYGDRFCMLQLVGKHEMDKVTLQPESDNNASKLLNGYNVLQAAAFATQAALQNPALQPLLSMANASPWLSGLYSGLQGAPGSQVPQAGMPVGTAPMLEAAIASQLSAQLNLSLLGPPQQPLSSSAPQATLLAKSAGLPRPQHTMGLGHQGGSVSPTAADAAMWLSGQGFDMGGMGMSIQQQLQALAGMGHGWPHAATSSPDSGRLMNTSTNMLSELSLPLSMDMPSVSRSLGSSSGHMQLFDYAAGTKAMQLPMEGIMGHAVW